MNNSDHEQAVSALLDQLILTAANSYSAVSPDSSTVLNQTVTQTMPPASSQQQNAGGVATGDIIASPANVTPSNSSNSLEQELQRLSGEVTILRQVNELNQDTLSANTKALEQAAANTSKSSSSSAADTAKSVGSFLLGGLGIGSLISGISSLFGGGDHQAPLPLVKYTPPPALQYQGAVTSGGQVSGYDYNDRGGIRPVDAAQYSQAGQASPQAGPQIVVQVNAMDSRSFLDHSDEIAQAVRAAMLNSSSLNDVISEM